MAAPWQQVRGGRVLQTLGKHVLIPEGSSYSSILELGLKNHLIVWASSHNMVV